MCYAHGGCPHEGVHECPVRPLMCEALITLAAAAVSKSFVACCLVREGSDLFRMGGASGREC